MTGTSDDEEGKWKNRSTTLRRLGRQYSPDVTPEVASRRLKQWIVGNPVLLKAGGTDCAGPWGTLKTEYET